MLIKAATRVAGLIDIVRPQGHPRCLTDKDKGSRMWNRACSATKWKISGMRSGGGKCKHILAMQGFTIAKWGTTRQEYSACKRREGKYNTVYSSEGYVHHSY